jgi:hypothetical protein
MGGSAGDCLFIFKIPTRKIVVWGTQPEVIGCSSVDISGLGHPGDCDGHPTGCCFFAGNR